MKIRFFKILVFLSFTIVLNFAENDKQPVRIYDLNDWMSFKNCNHPTSLTIGKDFVYFGTTGGIVGYNRYTNKFTEPYSVSDGLIDDNIRAVYYDQRTDYLWAAHSGGISYLTPTADSWEFVSAEDVMSPSNPVTRIGVYQDNIWALAPGGYIFKISRIPGQLSYVPETDISALKVDWNISYNDPLPNINNYFLHPNRYEIIDDNKIIGPELREFDISLFHTNVRKNIYGGAWGLGFLIGDSNIQSLTIYPYGPLNNSINAMAKIENGFCLAGSQTGQDEGRRGITFFYPSELEWDYVEPQYILNFPTRIIHEVAYKDRKLWYATDQGVLVKSQKNGEYTQLTVQDGLADEFIYTVDLEDSLAWAGSKFGLNLIYTDNYTTKRVYLSPDKFNMKVLKVEIGPQKVWIGTDNGLYSVNRDDHMVYHYDIFGDKIELKQPVVASYHAVAASDSVVVAHGRNSFLKYNRNSQKWSQLAELPDAGIVYDMAIYENYLWVGTNSGAYLINLDNNYREHYTRVDGLAGMRVFRIIVEEEDVWFGTDKGLTKYYWKKYVFKKN